MLYKDRDRSVPPTTQELLQMGFEKWQISMMRESSPEIQWEIYYEYIRVMMSDDNHNNYNE